MKKIFIVTSLLILFSFSFVFADEEGDSLRTKIRYQADVVGVNLSNVWTRVDYNRFIVILGGTLGSTQELHTLFQSFIGLDPGLKRVDQTIKTPKKNPYPQWFEVGFDPYKKEEDDKKEIKKKRKKEKKDCLPGEPYNSSALQT